MKRSLKFLLISASSLVSVQLKAQDGESAASSAPVADSTASKPEASEVTPPKDETPTAASVGKRPWRAGPFLALGLPHPIGIGGEGRLEKTYAANVSYGMFTYKKADTDTIQDFQVKMSHFEVGGAWFPWDGSFYVGSELGQQTLQVSAKSARKVSTGSGTNSEISLKADLKIVTWYLAPVAGWTWECESGFNWGTSLGLQFPLTSSSSFSATAEGVAGLDDAIKSLPEYQQLDNDVHAAGKKAGLLALPKWEIIRVGWYF